MDNPFLAPSALPFGYPDFDAIREEHFLPAFVEGMRQQRAEVDAITAAPATFADTVEALERSGAVLRRVSAAFFTLAGSTSTPGIREIEAQVAPLLAAHHSAITLDPALFAHLDTVHADRDGLDPESRRLAERYHRDAVRAGARLGPAEQDRLREIDAELSGLSTEFGARLLAGANAAAVLVDDPGRLDGLAPDAISAAANAATARGHDGAHLLTMVLPTGQPALASLTDRELRRRVHQASTTRGALGDDTDTRETVLRIAALRAERAALLGHPSHASWVIENLTAGSVEAVEAMLGQLTPVAARNARAEAAELSESAGYPIEAWDRAFHAERVRKERFDLDAAALRPYLELERVLHDGVFHAAHRLFGLSFTERHDLPRHHPEVRIFDVHDEDGQLGLFVADLFSRDSKRGGAWMNSFVTQSHLLGTTPIVLNTLNIPRAADGPTLLTIDLVRTLFHEFGHALHGLLSDVRFPTFAGTGVPRDVVEFPSQVNEMWLEHPEVLARYARHHETGEQLPGELIERLAASRTFGEGFATTEYLAATLLDLAWHRLGAEDEVDDVLAFETDALRAAGVDVPSAPPRYRSTYFNHVWGGSYSAGYYSYIWSEVLDADMVGWFTENGGLRRENGDRFRRELLSRGGSIDPMDAFRAVRGRDPEIGPLLERRGLTA